MMEQQWEGVWGDRDVVHSTVGLRVASLVAMETWSGVGKR